MYFIVPAFFSKFEQTFTKLDIAIILVEQVFLLFFSQLITLQNQDEYEFQVQK